MPDHPDNAQLPSSSVVTTKASDQSGYNSQKMLPPVERIAALFVRGKHGHASLPTGVTASLRRLDTNRPARSMSSVISTLVAAGLPVEAMSNDEITRWAVIVHAIALLSGTSGKSVHRSSKAAGKVIADASYSTTRFARLLTAQGDALAPQISRLTRFLAKAPGAVPLDLRPIAELLLWDERNSQRADVARMTLARGYYASAASTANTEKTGNTQ